jgi:hypothetical protein
VRARIVQPGTFVECRWIYAHTYQLGTDRVFDVELYAPAGDEQVDLYCSHADWLQVSDDGGITYVPVPATKEDAIQLGPLSAGQRKPLKVKVAIAAGTAVRTRSIELRLGFGTH